MVEGEDEQPPIVQVGSHLGEDASQAVGEEVVVFVQERGSVPTGDLLHHFLVFGCLFRFEGRVVGT